MTTQRTHESLEPSSVDMLARVVGEPSLANLAWALEHPEIWPEGFVWDYGNCQKCAYGLAVALWNELSPIYNGRRTGEHAAWAFRMKPGAADRIFMNANRVFGVFWFEITPRHIATLIHEYLAGREPAQGDAR